jgi:cobalt-zinc-cadmium efflux system membrane fusion protein
LEAVQNVENRPVVFTPAPGEPGVFRATPVRLGEPAGAYAQVLGGLSEGDEYVAHGAFILKAELGKASAEHQH